MKKILLLLTIALVFLHSSAQAANTVSDSLVTDLSCNNVTSKEIYRRMSPQQFTSFYHLPFVNWSVEAKSGMYELGVCWSLSRAQRLFFYLSRWGMPSYISAPSTAEVLNMIGGSSVYPMMLNQESHPRTDFGTLGNLMDGVSVRNGDKNNHRNFRSEIEKYEFERFRKIGKNLKYIIGSGSRSKNANRATKAQLITNIQGNKLTLIIIRPNRTAQHVVLVKRYNIDNNGDIQFYVYDSNHPTEDNVLTYRQADSNFYSPGIVYGVVPTRDMNEALGVYIVDEDERTGIENSLVRYYSSLCRSVNGK